MDESLRAEMVTFSPPLIERYPLLKVMMDQTWESRPMIENKLMELNITLPYVETPKNSYVPLVVEGNLVYLSGQTPKVNGEIKARGKVGIEISIDAAQEMAELCVLRALTVIKNEFGTLDVIKRIVKLTGFVNASEDFKDHPKVIDAASNVLEIIFGEKGRHARSAIGVGSLPDQSPVEIEMIVSIKD